MLSSNSEPVRGLPGIAWCWEKHNLSESGSLKNMDAHLLRQGPAAGEENWVVFAPLFGSAGRKARGKHSNKLSINSQCFGT